MVNTENISIQYKAVIPLNVNNENEIFLDEGIEIVQNRKIIDTILSGIKQPIYYSFESDNNSAIKNFINSIFSGDPESHIHIPSLIEDYFQSFQNTENKSSFLTMHHAVDIMIEDELCEAIVLCVLDEKDSFINVYKTNDINYSLKLVEGFSSTTISKVALIIKSENNKHRVLLSEAKIKGFEGRTWKDEFLKLNLIQDEYSFTTDYIKLTSKFIKDRVPIEEVLGKQQEVEMLNKTNDFFRENDRFDEETFKKNVFKNNELIEAFDDYKVKWQEKNNKQLNHEFEVSDEAWVNNQKVFKSVIKLDKNFHVYVHGDHKKIVKGEDEDGRKYYKLYYDQES